MTITGPREIFLCVCNQGAYADDLTDAVDLFLMLRLNTNRGHDKATYQLILSPYPSDRNLASSSL